MLFTYKPSENDMYTYLSTDITDIIAGRLTEMSRIINQDGSTGEIYSRLYSFTYHLSTQTLTKFTHKGEHLKKSIDKDELLVIIGNALKISFKECIPDSESRMNRLRAIILKVTYTFRYLYQDRKEEIVNDMIKKAIESPHT